MRRRGAAVAERFAPLDPEAAELAEIRRDAAAAGFVVVLLSDLGPTPTNLAAVDALRARVARKLERRQAPR